MPPIAMGWLVGHAAGFYLIGFHQTAALAEGFVIIVFDMLLRVFWPTPALFEPFLEGWI